MAIKRLDSPIQWDDDEVRRNLDSMARKAPDEIERALFQEALVETAESKRKTPVDTGDLRGSHETAKPEWSGRNVTVEISVGGSAAPYAIYVHEDLEAEHKVGEAKFLEKTLDESRPFMPRRIAKRIDLNRIAR